MTVQPLDGSIEAEYEDGYVHSETLLGDISPFVPETANILNDVLEKRPQALHGRLVRVSCFWHDARYDVDFTKLPDNARPIRFKHMQRDYFTNGTPAGPAIIVSVEFGYQYTDTNGSNVQQVEVFTHGIH